MNLGLLSIRKRLGWNWLILKIKFEDVRHCFCVCVAHRFLTYSPKMVAMRFQLSPTPTVAQTRQQRSNQKMMNEVLKPKLEPLLMLLDGQLSSHDEMIQKSTCRTLFERPIVESTCINENEHHITVHDTHTDQSIRWKMRLFMKINGFHLLKLVLNAWLEKIRSNNNGSQTVTKPMITL